MSIPDHRVRLIAEFGMDFYHPQDLDKFFEKFAPRRVGQRPKLLSIAGGEYSVSLHMYSRSALRIDVHRPAQRVRHQDRGLYRGDIRSRADDGFAGTRARSVIVSDRHLNFGSTYR